MKKKYRHILPVPDVPASATAAAGRSDQADPTKRKRSSTVMACNSCRAKKSAVCHVATLIPAVTR